MNMDIRSRMARGADDRRGSGLLAHQIRDTLRGRPQGFRTKDIWTSSWPARRRWSSRPFSGQSAVLVPTVHDDRDDTGPLLRIGRPSAAVLAGPRGDAVARTPARATAPGEPGTVSLLGCLASWPSPRTVTPTITLAGVARPSAPCQCRSQTPRPHRCRPLRQDAQVAAAPFAPGPISLTRERLG